MKSALAAVALLAACTTSVAALWPKFQEAGVPRTADGKPDLSGI